MAGKSLVTLPNLLPLGAVIVAVIPLPFGPVAVSEIPFAEAA
jgi:hypothetical protein